MATWWRMSSPVVVVPGRSAVSRGGWLAVFALVACWSSTPQPKTTTDARHPGQPLAIVSSGRALGLEGVYWCSITQGDGALGQDQFTYPKFQCQITRDDGRLVLAKLGGSQRFTGDIIETADGGFRFAGQFYCPWGSCTAPLHGDFHPERDGVMIGRFSDDTRLHVRLWRAADPAFGNGGYGGAAYGGAMYGGVGYARHRRAPRP